MYHDPVQFQKGTHLNGFLSKYETEEQCFDSRYQCR